MVYHALTCLCRLQLGLERTINPLYVPFLRKSFQLPQSVGFIGGCPASSFYFVAAQGDSTVVYLDPHTIQPTVDMAAEGFLTESFHSRAVRTMRLQHIDPSLTLGFLVTDAADFADLCDRLPVITGEMLCNIAEREPDVAAETAVLFSGSEDDEDGFSLV